MAYVLRPFEKDIIKNFKTFSPTEGGGRSRSRKGVWIRGHLLDVGKDYVYGMWKTWKKFTEAARHEHAKIDGGSYSAFKTYIWLLKKLGLITLVDVSPGKGYYFKRHYYAVVPGKVKSKIWLNPYKQYPSWRKWEKRKFGRI